jgi:hypothetical protein
MFKKAMIAAAAALSIGGAMAATSADAAPWHGGGWGGGWHGGWHDGGWRGYGWRAPVVYAGPVWGYRGGCGWRWSPYWGHYVRACW